MVTAIEAEIILKLVFAAALGAIIGLERELNKKPAGMRTHALVCMGAALFTVISFSFQNENVDVSRVAAGVVTGIGFLGAGVIWQIRNKVHGLTTAADMWAVAAIGLAVGMGLYLIAIAAAALMLVLLVPGKVLENALKRRR